MDRRILEAIAEAIAHYSGYQQPGSPLYAARNPIGLRPMKAEQPRDEQGHRIFRSVLDGMQAALFDLETKLTARMTPESTLADLAMAYGRQLTEAQAWARFLRQALNDNDISARTQIRRFIDGR
jgi:hypothetical protein